MGFQQILPLVIVYRATTNEDFELFGVNLKLN